MESEMELNVDRKVFWDFPDFPLDIHVKSSVFVAELCSCALNVFAKERGLSFVFSSVAKEAYGSYTSRGTAF